MTDQVIELEREYYFDNDRNCHVLKVHDNERFMISTYSVYDYDEALKNGDVEETYQLLESKLKWT